MQKKEKNISEHVTFRINKTTLDELKSISKNEKVSLNTLANKVFDSHVNWDVHVPEVGWVVMLKSGLTELIKQADTETISRIAKETAETNAKEISLYMRGNYGISEWISILKDRARNSGFKLKEYITGNKIKLVQHHDMGEKWSLFFKIFYETIFYDLGVKVNSDSTDNSVVIELENV
jgi:hypothetical protein